MSDDSALRGPLAATSATEGGVPGEESRASPSSRQETAGSTVPRYRILGLAGIGGMGVVYRAEDTRLGRTVALKFLPPTLTPNPRAKARFLDEARAASALDHPNICTIYEVGETAEGQLYLAMASYEGETLKRRLKRGPLPAAEALQIALQIARGLAKAHRHGIVHRDIKPANLMITADDIVKILDFGIARLPDQALSGPLLGTPGYMSPEQERGGVVDARSDVWSLGVVLREMLTGWQPGRGGQAEVPSGEEPPAPPLGKGAPPGIEGILSCMLAEEPADRYSDAAAALADLAALERVATGVEGTPVSGRRRWLPARLVVLAAIFVAALAASAGSWFLQNVRRQGGAGPDSSQATLTPFIDLPGKEWFPSLTPDGNLLVYARNVGDRSHLFLRWVGGGTAIGHQIAFRSKRAGGGIFVMGLMGGTAIDLSDLSAHLSGGGYQSAISPDDSQPAISPDGHQIAFRSERDGGGIFIMELVGGSVWRVTDVGFNPAWSPDSKEILYDTGRVNDPLTRKNPTSEIYRVNLETGKRWRISTDDAMQPSWSPHGFRIAYWGISPWPSGRQVIWTVAATGGKAVQVTDGQWADWNPVWSPDGRYLYFASDDRSGNGLTTLWRVPIEEHSGQAQGEPKPVSRAGHLLESSEHAAQFLARRQAHRLYQR